MMMRVGRTELEAIVAARSVVLDTADNPFATAAFTLHFLDCVARDDWTFWAGDALGATLLLYAQPSAPTRLRALTNYYASLFSPLAGAADAGGSKAALALARALTDLRPAVATVDMSPLEEADGATIAGAFKSAGWLTRQYVCFGNWYLPCEGLSFDAYMAGRPSQTVNTWARKAKKFKPGDRKSVV